MKDRIKSAIENDPFLGKIKTYLENETLEGAFLAGGYIRDLAIDRKSVV